MFASSMVNSRYRMRALLEADSVVKGAEQAPSRAGVDRGDCLGGHSLAPVLGAGLLRSSRKFLLPTVIYNWLKSPHPRARQCSMIGQTF